MYFIGSNRSIFPAVSFTWGMVMHTGSDRSLFLLQGGVSHLNFRPGRWPESKTPATHLVLAANHGRRTTEYENRENDNGANDDGA